MIYTELLAPAKNADIGRQAILHGADAVYIGAPSHGARAAAANNVDDIASLCRFAHLYGARVYVTLNTLVYDDEIPAVEALVNKLYKAEVDALIVQDMGLLRMKLPPIALHASTQCDIRTPEKARFLADMGFRQLVVPRESTLEEVRAIRRAVPPDTVLEGFVHGALCVSYSGDCQASLAATGRSANRGCCAQICRLPFDLVDARGNTLIRGRHLLSLRDLNRIDALGDMLDAGIASFKIEGRLKDADYVKNITAAYRRALDKAMDARPGHYARASAGTVATTFTPDPAKAFNRGFTPYFLTSAPETPMGSHLTPKFTGPEVGKVVKTESPRRLKAHLHQKLANGDGLGYFDSTGLFHGFRLNRIDGDTLHSATDIAPSPGTTLYRNSDKTWNDALAAATATRTITVDMTLRMARNALILDIVDETGISVSVATHGIHPDEARTPQAERRRATLMKTGDTPFKPRRIDDRLADLFIPASTLADLRRRALEALATARLLVWRRPAPGAERTDVMAPTTTLSYHDNVANSAARRFYADHGVTDIQPALEIAQPQGPKRVMTTRYCLRRELGACLREGGADRLPGPLSLRAPGIVFDLDFDCRNCRMHVLTRK